MSDLQRIGDKMADAAQAVLDHAVWTRPADVGYDAQLHVLELQSAVKAWLKARQDGEK